jgi:lysine/ornithine N-monooxygenase
VDAEETVTEFLLSNEQTLSTQKIAIVGSGGGAYEVVYTLKKVVGSLSEHISGPRTLAPVARLPGSLDSTASEDYSSPNFIAMAETVTDGYSFKGSQSPCILFCFPF